MSSPTIFKWVAILAILCAGIIHFLEAPESFDEATYKGLLFVANGVGALVAAAGVLYGRRWGWPLGLLVTGGAFVAYVLSRTVGLPSLPAEPDAWLEPPGIASLICEGVFILLFFMRPREPRRAT